MSCQSVYRDQEVLLIGTGSFMNYLMKKISISHDLHDFVLTSRASGMSTENARIVPREDCEIARLPRWSADRHKMEPKLRKRNYNV